MIPFSKYHGAGNDFILIDNRNGAHSVDDPNWIRHLCDRRAGIGADGVLILETSTVADYKMRIFNADGSIPSMCGNGIRCAFDFLARKMGSDQLQIEIADRILSCRWDNEKIRVDLGVPLILHWPLHLPLSGGVLPIYVLNTGVPHAVVCVGNIRDVPLLELGKEIRFNPAFAPSGLNVNFVEMSTDGSILLRTFERGVEAETLSCGTGAAAAAWVARGRGVQGPLSIKTRLGFDSYHFEESLLCLFSMNSQGEYCIEMIGPAHCVFTGQVK